MKNLLRLSAAFIIITSAFAQRPDSTLRELPDQRTYWSKTYYNAKDNTYKSVVSAGYVHYLASDGTFKDINPNLRAATDGSYRVDEGLYKAAFAGAIGQGNWDMAYEIPKLLHPQFIDPGKPLVPAQFRWKILSLGYFDAQSKAYAVIQNANAVTPIVSGSSIGYLQIFNGVDVKYTCENIRLKEELVLSQIGRNSLPDPTQYGITQNNAYLMMAMEFALMPTNLKVLANTASGKVVINSGSGFAFAGDERIDVEDDLSNLHFFFPKNYAWAVNDSATGFVGRIGVTRVFYSQNGKDYLLVGVPYGWVAGSPTGTLMIDPTATVATSEDVWLEDQFNKNSFDILLIGKAAYYNKKRTIIKFNVAGIPPSATVLNARLKMKYYSVFNTNGAPWVDRWVQAHQLLVNWNETQADSIRRLTGTNWALPHGAIDGTDAKSAYESKVLFQQDYPNWKYWNLTGLTQKWLNGSATNYGVILWATNENTVSTDLRLYSSSAANHDSIRPKLEVTWSTEAKTVYFLKDHLGSIRVTVLDSVGAPVVGYDDYDPWGYPLVGRTKKTPYDSLQKIAKNKFTGKERDDDFGLNLDYFGARYYDPQIGRWMSVDPLALKHPDVTPYNYVLNNPMILVDPDGRQVHYSYAQRANELLAARGRGASEAELNQIRESHQRIDQAAAASVGLIAAAVLAAEAVPYIIAAALSRPVETTEIITGALTPGAENVTVGAASKIANVVDDVGKAAAKGQIHHIATDKAIASGFTEKFQAIFSKAGMSLQDEANKIFLQGHAGRHSLKYHEFVLDRLNRATKGLSGEKYTKALRDELDAIKADLVKNPDMVKGVGLE